jgi:CubicO group peptidase (beta-lactamase class C family)
VDWTERPPGEVGMDPAGLDRAVEMVTARRAVAQLCVLRDGEVVLDRTFGCDDENLFPLFSVSKPFVALLAHLLAQQGKLRLDDPVAEHWPEYAGHGKENITVRHVLAHRAGVPYATGSMLGDSLAMRSWRRSVRHAERARPRWPSGEVPAYHVLTYGFILGELVRRVGGGPLPAQLDRNLLAPLGLDGIHLGLPRALWPRRVPMRTTATIDLGRQWMINRPGTSRAIIPAAGVFARARDLARFYQMLLAGGKIGGVRVLDSATIAEATRESGGLETDRVLRRPVRWGHGFELGGSPEVVRPMGRGNGPAAFGHNGSSICNAWADPARGLVFAYLTNLGVMPREGLAHQCEISDAILSACTS